jgi:ubiquinone/menaquinone biosynthesis C-methylase UbiE
MRMSNVEKRFVNTQWHAQKNVKLVDRLLSKLELGSLTRALEIGCGAGFVAAHLRTSHEMTVVGTDVDPEQIEIAKRYHHENEQLMFVEADATQLPFGDNEFDMVLSFHVLHHIGDWQRALEEINRVLRPQGYFILHDFAYSRLTVKLLTRIVKKYGIYTIDDITDFFGRYNYEVRHNEQRREAVMKKYSIVFQKQ